MGSVNDRIQTFYDEWVAENYPPTPQEKLFIVRQRLSGLEAALDREIDQLRTRLLFLEQDCKNAAYRQDRMRVTMLAKDITERRWAMRHHERNRKMVRGYILRIDDTRIDEVLNESLYAMNLHVSEVAALSDHEAILSNVRLFTRQQMTRRNTQETMGDEMFESLSGEEGEEAAVDDSQVNAMVESMLTDAAQPLLEKLPVLSGLPDLTTTTTRSTATTATEPKVVAPRSLIVTRK